MGWVGGIAVSILLKTLDYLKVIPELSNNPIGDIAVKGIIFGFIVIAVKEVAPV